MNYFNYLLTFIVGGLILVSCGNKKHSTDVLNNTDGNLPVIELQADYPHKDVDLHDLADVTYIPLETTDESLIGAVGNFFFCNDTILIEDIKQHKILMFNTEGKYLSSFRRIGNGNTDYTGIGSMCVDVDAHEIFILDFYRMNRIIVYDFTGNFVRELTIDQDLGGIRIFNCDQENLLLFSKKDMYKTSFGEKVSGYPYYLISKQTGKATPVPLWVENRKNNSFSVRVGKDSIYSTAIGFGSQLINSPRGIVISDYALDTVYRYANHTLEPLFVRHADNDHQGLLSGLLLTNDDFSLIGIAEAYIQNNKIDTSETRLLLYDHHGGQVNEINLTNSDIPAHVKVAAYSVDNSQYPSDVLTAINYSADYLLEQYREGGLSGKLKEIAAGLSEEDNPVLVLVKFKE